MDHSNRIIAKKIEDGQYFKDAMDWYADKYLLSFSIRNYMLIITVALLCSLWMILNQFLAHHENVSYYFPIPAPDETKYFARITPITKGHEEVNVSVARYLLQYYVTSRESYSHKILTETHFREKMIKIRRLSSRKIYDGFIDYMNASTNINSPLVIFNDSVSRIVSVDKLEFDNDELPQRAKVFYQVTDKSPNKEEKQNICVDIEFSMTDIKKVKENNVNFQFYVTKYDKK